MTAPAHACSSLGTPALQHPHTPLCPEKIFPPGMLKDESQRSLLGSPDLLFPTAELFLA
jgi:hypothetical protein